MFPALVPVNFKIFYRLFVWTYVVLVYAANKNCDLCVFSRKLAAIKKNPVNEDCICFKDGPSPPSEMSPYFFL